MEGVALPTKMESAGGLGWVEGTPLPANSLEAVDGMHVLMAVSQASFTMQIKATQNRH